MTLIHMNQGGILRHQEQLSMIGETTWVVTRSIPGNAKGQARITEYLVGDSWIDEDIWKAAERANIAGTSTQEQIYILKAGHKLAK